MRFLKQSIVCPFISAFDRFSNRSNTSGNAPERRVRALAAVAVALAVGAGAAHAQATAPVLQLDSVNVGASTTGTVTFTFTGTTIVSSVAVVTQGVTGLDTPSTPPLPAPALPKAQASTYRMRH
jgi:hypothetical protein